MTRIKGLWCITVLIVALVPRTAHGLVCSGHGVSVDGGCACDSGYYTIDCSVFCDPSSTCNGHGSCDASFGTCICSGYFAGTSCDSCSGSRTYASGCTECQSGLYGSGCLACPNCGASNATDAAYRTCDQGVGGTGQCICTDPGALASNCQVCDLGRAFCGDPTQSVPCANSTSAMATCLTSSNGLTSFDSTCGCSCTGSGANRDPSTGCQDCLDGFVGPSDPEAACSACPVGGCTTPQTCVWDLDMEAAVCAGNAAGGPHDTQTASFALGFHFLGPRDNVRQLLNGSCNPYYAPEKPTLVIVHGHRPGAVDAGASEPDADLVHLQYIAPELYLHTLDTETSTIDQYAHDAWRESGYNVAVYNWAQYADEEAEEDAQAKIWNSRFSPVNMRFKFVDDRSGEVATEKRTTHQTTQSMAERFATDLQDALGDTESSVQFVAYGIGAQLVVGGLAVWGSQYPGSHLAAHIDRIDFVDPIWCMVDSTDVSTEATANRTALTALLAPFKASYYDSSAYASNSQYNRYGPLLAHVQYLMQASPVLSTQTFAWYQGTLRAKPASPRVWPWTDGTYDTLDFEDWAARVSTGFWSKLQLVQMRPLYASLQSPIDFRVPPAFPAAQTGTLEAGHNEVVILRSDFDLKLYLTAFESTPFNLHLAGPTLPRNCTACVFDQTAGTMTFTQLDDVYV